MARHKLFTAWVFAVAIAVAGCRGEQQAVRRCRADAHPPGAAAFPDELANKIRASPIPAEARSKSRRCNRLVLEPSAYARRHALDPVDWHAWSPAVLVEAEGLRRPILVLTGFSASDERALF